MKNVNIQSILLDIFDYSYTNSPVRVPAKACREIGKILHIGMFIEEHLNNIPAFSFNSKLLSKNKIDKKNTDKIATYIKEIYVKMNSKWNLYDDDILFTEDDIAYIVTKLSKVHISDPEKDVFGDALELFRSQWAKQEGGQFFTDQRVTSLAISMVDFNPLKGDTLVDYCAGTGGFLLAALNRIKRIADKEGEDESFITSWAKKTLYGYEIDDSVAELGNATLNARTGASNRDFIKQSNSLRKDANLKKFSKAVTNPPFGAKISIQDEEILSQYELAKLSNSNCDDLSIRYNKLFKRAPDILFVERNIQALEEKGLLAIVVPYQILSGPQTYYVRNWILKNTKVLASIDLPAETFQPHTGTKTCLLVVEKLKQPHLSLDQVKDYEIFMACPKWIGHDRRGNILYQKNIDGTSSTEILTDFPELEQAYENYREKKTLPRTYKEAFIINSSTILSDNLLRINAAFHNPIHSNKISNINQSNFEMVKLGNLVERVFCPGRFKRNYVEKYDLAVPFLGGTNITQMIRNTNKWLRHDDPKLKFLAVKKGWILVTRSGTTGIVSSVPDYWDGYAISEHVIRIVPNCKIESSYLLAYLKTPQCQAALAQGVFGSVIDEITPETIENITIPIPKENKLYKKICSDVFEAEKARSKSLEKLYTSIEYLDNALQT